MGTDAEYVYSPIASNPDISGIGVRMAIYTHIAITSVLLLYFRNDDEYFRTTGRRLCIFAVSLVVAGAWQSRNTGLSLVDAALILVTVYVVGVYGSILAGHMYNHRSLPDFAFFGWAIAYLSWILITFQGAMYMMDKWWHYLLMYSLPVVSPWFVIYLWLPDQERNGYYNPIRFYLPIAYLLVYLPGTIVVIEIIICNDDEPGDLNQWTYGQILPVLLLASPILELLSEIWKRYSPSVQAAAEEVGLPGAGAGDLSLGGYSMTSPLQLIQLLSRRMRSGRTERVAV